MKESQSFHPFVIVLSVFTLVFVNFLLVYLSEMQPVLVFLIMLFNFTLGLVILFTQLKVEYDHDRIRLRFFPLLFKEKNIHWSEVDRAYIRSYSPLKEFGGWGIRVSRKKYGKAYNTRGNLGLQLVMNDGSKVLIGTQKPGELEEFLNELYKLNVVRPEADQSEK